MIVSFQVFTSGWLDPRSLKLGCAELWHCGFDPYPQPKCIKEFDFGRVSGEDAAAWLLIHINVRVGIFLQHIKALCLVW